MTGMERAGLTASAGSAGSIGTALDDVRTWLGRFVKVTRPLDLDLLTLWTAHTYTAFETYTTPRLVIDSLVPGSGKTTVLEHLAHLACAPVQAASITSPALLGRLFSRGPCTLLIDEADRTLNPKREGVGELIAILNSGYKRGNTRPVNVPDGKGKWEVEAMSTFAPVAMAGNAPDLPDDTASRCVRVLLVPDRNGEAEDSDWELLEADALALQVRLAEAMDAIRERIRDIRPDLPEGCRGRMAEKWRPLTRIAALAGGRWPAVVVELIESDMERTVSEAEEGLMHKTPHVILLNDIREVWRTGERFVPTTELVTRLIGWNTDYWGMNSPYGRALTVQRLGRLLHKANVRATRPGGGESPRGYTLASLLPLWAGLGIAPPQIEPAEPAEAAEPAPR